MGTRDVHVPRVPSFCRKSGLGTRGDVILQLALTILRNHEYTGQSEPADNTMLILQVTTVRLLTTDIKTKPSKCWTDIPRWAYRGGKYSAYEAGTRIPFIIRWPAGIKPSKQQALFHKLTFMPLLPPYWNNLYGKTAPDSQEHLRVLLGKEAVIAIVVQQNLNNTLAIVKGQWKYIEPVTDQPLNIGQK